MVIKALKRLAVIATIVFEAANGEGFSVFIKYSDTERRTFSFNYFLT